MSLRFTTPDFQQDFSNTPLNVVEENHWFNDQFFTKYSFPVQFEISEELDVALKMITHNNSARSAKKFDGYLEIFGGETEAVLIIERIQGKIAQGKFRYGLEEFPNFGKKLSELPLERFTLQEPINTFALARLNQKYPEVNFNFPQLIVDAFDPTTEQWQYFEGILNNYRAGAFVENEFDSESGEQINRNIMQPVPYLLYVIAQGFADAGLELRGDILEDPDLKDAVITIISDYYSTASSEAIEMYLQANEYDYIDNNIDEEDPRYDPQEDQEGYYQLGVYSASLLLDSPGVYKIAGNVILRTRGTFAWANLKTNGSEIIWSASNPGTQQYQEHYYSLDRNVEVSVSDGTATLDFASKQLPFAIIDETQDPEAIVLDLTITKIAGYDQDGNLVPSLVSPEEINLQKVVPDITFGDLIKIIKNWKNYDVVPGDGYVEMNKIQNQMKVAEVVDLSHTEVMEPIRNFYQDSSFLLQFQDISSEEYKFEKMFVDSTGARTTSFQKREDTQEITINGIPLPHKQKGSVNTAHLFIDAKNILALAIYPGLTNNLNTCVDASNLLIPGVYANDWSEWLDFRINAEGFEWPFSAVPFLAGKITRNAKIYAYGRNFFVRRVSKKNTSRNYWEVVLECDGGD